MAQSKTKVPGTPKYFLECNIENCERNCEFYCNPCHQQLCKQCRDEHLKSPENKNHEVVLYQQLKRQLPVEQCKIHPIKEIDILCNECQVPLCSKCATMESHWGHKFIDLETVYTEKITLCEGGISKIDEYFLPTSQDLQKEINGDATEVKKIMESIRTSMKAEAEPLKKMVDAVVSENLEEVNEIEQSLLKILKNQDKTFTDYMNYLNGLLTKFYGYLSSKELTELITNLSEKSLEIEATPETTKPTTPAFTAGQYSKEDVAKLLGKINVPDTKEEKRKIKPLKIAPPLKSEKFISKQSEQDRDLKSDVKQTLSLSSSVTKVREFQVSGVHRAVHISLDQLGILWVTAGFNTLIQKNLQGNFEQGIEISGRWGGYYTVTQDGDLILTDEMKNDVQRFTQDDGITKFFTTRDWTPISIHSSKINGDLLVGMKRYEEAKVTRYNKAGEELQKIQRDSKLQGLYSEPWYITENINGDICTSDNKNAVVVVNKSGQYIFSYTGQKSEFSPAGICTDVLGHILVCEIKYHSVHLLNQDGQFLSYLLSQQEVRYPCCVCVDDENNLYVGQITNTVKVYKYLQ